MKFTVMGIEFNDSRLAKLSFEVLDDLAYIGIKPCKLVSIKLREQNMKFGCCHTRYNKTTKVITNNRITINRKFVEQDADDKAIKTVLAHEILHAVDGCHLCGHNGKWAELADLVNDCYNMDIKRYGSYEKYGIERKERNTYRCQCDRCGKIMTYKGYRAPKWYKHPLGYTHTCPDGGKSEITSEYFGALDEELAKLKIYG